MSLETPAGQVVGTADQFVKMAGLSWDDYEALLRMRGERRRPRLVYLDGVVELMTTSEDHEAIKMRISRLAEAYMLHAGMTFGAFGPYTMKDATKKAGIEPDECYRIGPDQTRGRTPDLAIEVVWTHGGMKKLDAYLRLGVREVWIWDDWKVDVYYLVDGAYERRTESVVIPGIDLPILAKYAREPLSDAIRAYSQLLRERG